MQIKFALMIGGNGVNRNLDRTIMYFKLSGRSANAKAHLKVEMYFGGTSDKGECV